MTIEDYIRDGQVIEDRSVHLNNLYRGVFIDRNFYLYKFVPRTLKFKGDMFGDDILVLVYSNVINPSADIPPAVIHVKMHKEYTEELRGQLR